MPIHNRFFRRPNQEQSPEGLSSAGPLLQVQVMVPPALAALLGQSNQPIPVPGSGWALIDTGATRTCVDKAVLDELQVQATGAITTGTAAGPAQQLLYPAKLNFPGANFEIEFGSVIGVDLRGQSIAGQNVIVLLGRDVLSRCVLIYNGPGGTFTLAI
jgi:predicted aspartyl protease